MSRRVYISADYAPNDGDQEVIELLHKWGSDHLHKVEYCDTTLVVSGSVAKDSDCRPCDLKAEFNKQINASSAVIFIVGDKTALRTAGNICERIAQGSGCGCTPYKQNANGRSTCKIYGTTYTPGPDEDLGKINSYSYLKHEFLQAVRKQKSIIIFYNSFYKQPKWLPDYMSEYEEIARPFWVRNYANDAVGDYQYLKNALGYE